MKDLKLAEQNSNKIMEFYVNKINEVLQTDISNNNKLKLINDLSKQGLYYSKEEFNKKVIFNQTDYFPLEEN